MSTSRRILCIELILCVTSPLLCITAPCVYWKATCRGKNLNSSRRGDRPRADSAVISPNGFNPSLHTGSAYCIHHLPSRRNDESITTMLVTSRVHTVCIYLLLLVGAQTASIGRSTFTVTCHFCVATDARQVAACGLRIGLRSTSVLEATHMWGSTSAYTSPLGSAPRRSLWFKRSFSGYFALSK